MSALKAFPDKVLVKEDEFKYHGMLTIPDKSKRRPQSGVVIDAGSSVTLVKPGDHVLYAQFSGTGVQIKNHPAYRILTEDELLCLIVEDVEIEELSA